MKGEGFLIEILTEWTYFTLLAIALGLDGFSVCLAIGMYNLRLRRIFLIGILIGFFHILLPFIGMLIGRLMSLQWTNLAAIIGSFLLVFIGLYMIFSSLQQVNTKVIYPYGLRLLTIVFFVSVDSFPVGLSLGLVGVKTAVFVFLFGMVTMFLAWVGLLLGKKTSQWFGAYSEMVGGFILLLFGLAQLFVFPS